MPPHVARKRLHSPSNAAPRDEPPAKKRAAVATSRTSSYNGMKPKQSTAKQQHVDKANKKPTSVLDAADSRPKSVTSLEENVAYLKQLDEENGTSDDSESEVDSDDFEDVVASNIPITPSPGKWQKVNGHANVQEYIPGNTPTLATTASAVSEDEMDWEDAMDASSTKDVQPDISGDLELTLDSIPTNSLASFTDPHGKKKGPSKIERSIRMNTHCMHVQFLMFHNLIRNGWCCDKDLHKILVHGLSPGVKKEVTRWRQACGYAVEQENKGEVKSRHKEKKSGKKNMKKDQKQRDWGKDATFAANDGTPNLSRGDPTIKLLKILVAYWRKRFSITAPGIRRQGYKDLARLEQEVKSLHNDKHDPEEHGERIRGRKEFRNLAKKCTGSRDVGAQLFTALVRGLGLETRLVASLQPVGFGWSKIEDAHPKKASRERTELSKKKKKKKDFSDSSSSDNDEGNVAPPSESKPSKAQPKQVRSAKSSSNGSKHQPISLTTDESELSSAKSIMSNSDDESVVDFTPSIPINTSSKRYDRALIFPVYWTEVLSPITQSWIPIDPITLNLVASNPESLIQFEPRGAKADKVKQVFAYVVAFSSDGTAKDVTTRYLKRHMWPGKTKGVRLPIEKIPVYNKHGKIKHHEEYDWFKRVMAGYARSSEHRTIADDKEDSTDLVPAKVVRDASKGNEETLQGYKNSEEFVLERHLRREEALVHGAKSVRTFATGKGDKAKSEPVYLRKDVVKCKTIESWHKEGREVKEGQRALKHVPMRAVTITRKREIEEVERETGEKQKQPLYSWDQTQWIIPSPIEDGVIPKNAYGNMDVYVPTMVPKGAVHIPFRGTARVCKKLEIDFAEACTGFEFGNKMAVPILTGVVVAKENERLVKDAWRADEEARRKKEQDKREKLALGMWKKMLAGLKIVQRVRKEYGLDAESHIAEAIHPMAAKKKAGKTKQNQQQKGDAREERIDLTKDNDDESDAGHPLFKPGADYSGGFIREGEDEGEMLDVQNDEESGGGGGFIIEENDTTTTAPREAGGFILEEDENSRTSNIHESKSTAKATGAPFSLQSMHLKVQDEDEDELKPKEKSGKNRRNGTSKKASVIAPKKRGRKPKAVIQASKDEYDSLSSDAESSLSSLMSPSSDDENSDHGEYEGDERKNKRNTSSRTPTKPTSRSKRQSAQRSSAAVKSHYFKESVDDSDDSSVDGDSE